MEEFPELPRMERREPDEQLDSIARIVVDAAYKVHTALGPGLLESVYEKCMLFELHKRGLKCEAQLDLPIQYQGCLIDAGYRLDMLVEDLLVVEIKAVEKLLPVHQAQLMTYLKLSNKQLGLLINFNSALIRDGIKRIVRSE
jgi:GxxExxY protein